MKTIPTLPFGGSPRLLALAIALGLATNVSAQQTFFDDFNRADGDPGANWTHLTSAQWEIIGGQVVSAIDPVEMAYNGLTLDAKPFSIQADFWTTTSRWYGIPFHIDTTEAGTYWLFRLNPGSNGVQLLRFENESLAQIAINASVSGDSLTLEDTYRLRVDAPETGNVEVRIFEVEEGGAAGVERFMGSHDITAGIPAGGGYAGLWANGSGVRGNDFQLEVIPEPATVGLGVGMAALLGAFAYRRVRRRGGF